MGNIKIHDYISVRIADLSGGELPDRIEPGYIYLNAVQSDDGKQFPPYRATYCCPCGCGRTVALDLLTEYGPPSWTMECENPPTFSPSIRMINGCLAHYFIKAGKVVWA